MAEEEKFIIKITDNGAVMNCHILSTMLSFLLTMKQMGKIKTIEEAKDNCISQLKKSLHWLDRPDDKTSNKKDKEEAKKMVVETLKMIEKLWKLAM